MPQAPDELAAPPSYRLAAQERSMAILELLPVQPLRGSDVARRLDLKWTTAYRALRSLEELGYIVQDGADSTYRIGPELYRLGASYVASHPVARAAAPLLGAAANAVRTAGQLVERQGHMGLPILAIDATDTIPSNTVGHHFPLPLAAKGRVLLAYAPGDVVDAVLAGPLRRMTRHTVTDPQAVREELEVVREQGYALSMGDVQHGVGAVAAPVRAADGSVTHCISLAGKVARLRVDAYRQFVVETAVDTARQVSIACGWTP